MTDTDRASPTPRAGQSDPALLDRLREIRDRRTRHAPERPVEHAGTTGERTHEHRAAAASAFDFSTLKDYEALRLQRAAADMLGLDSPFFRSHSSVDGVVSRIGNHDCINFASYDYLGLNAHPSVRKAASDAAEEWGVSATASRLVGGERPFHEALETALASWLGTESAIVMPSGHATNVTTLGTLLGPRDLVLSDAFIHNSITEGCRLAGATRVVFPHNNLDWIDDYLLRNRGRYERALICVEGLYSMDGDVPDLPGLIALKSRHDAWLMVDEAHALGVLGNTGRGLAELTGTDPRHVEIWMGTLSKTLASCGGFIAGSQALIEFLKFKAPGFVFSVGVAAPIAAAATAALALLEREPERVSRLHKNGAHFLDKARSADLDCGYSQGFAVAPIITQSSLQAVTISDQLLEQDINVLPIIFPAVPEKSARLRFFVTSEHTPEMIDTAIDAVAAVPQATPPRA